MKTTLLILGALLVILPAAYVLRAWWMCNHPRYPVCPDDDGPSTYFDDRDDFRGMGT